MTGERRVALVTGADRGIGYAVVERLARDGHRAFLAALPGFAEAATARLAGEGLAVSPLDLDVTDAVAIKRAVEEVRRVEDRLDILVNNAGVGYDPDESASSVDLDRVRATLEVNLLGPWRLAQAVVPSMRAQRYGRIVNVSSDAGSFALVARPPVYPGTPGYSTSKAAQNMLTVKLAAELVGVDILVNAINPGWVRTEMGGPDAPRTPEEAAADVVWLATLPTGGPSGRFFDGRTEAGW